MNDMLLELMFNPFLWEELIEKARAKGINKAHLRQFCKPEVRVKLYEMIRDNKLMFEPGHQAAIPKPDSDEKRIVYVGETTERLVCSLINDCLFELFPELVHRSCKSYQKGLSCQKTVKELSENICKANSEIVGVKFDFHHYFDDINKESIFALFDKIEDKLGFERNTEPVMNLLRRTWSSNLLFDVDGNLIEKWSGIRQGNAIGSFMADAIMYELDEYMSNKYSYYVRYSDDLIVMHSDPEEVSRDINNIITKYGVSLNPKKIEIITKNKYVKFLGYSIKGRDISISKGRLKTFQKEIEKRTIKKKNISLNNAINSVQSYLYKGNGEYAWATQILPIVNNTHDINEMNSFILDCLRAVSTGKKKLGGLGYVPTNKEGVVVRGSGRNVTANKNKMQTIDGFKSLGCMRNALLTSRAAYDTLVRSM